eukprot:gene1444-12063_t
MKISYILCVVFLVLFQQIYSKTVDLTLGKPAEAEVSNNGYVYFKLLEIPDPLPAEKNVIFTVTPFTGDSDLYISHTTETPTAENHMWKDTRDLISNIGVRAYTNSSFTILAHITDDHVQLTDGHPQLNDVNAYTYQYYEYELKEAGRLTISLTAIQGDPDIFVSMITNRPSWTNHTWAHYDIGTDILIIENAVVGKYYIGITSFGHAKYNILSTGYNTVARIAEFVPIVEDVASRTYKYFKFRLLDNTGLEITVNKLRNSGDPDIFVSTVHEKPSSENHEWKGINYGDDTIVIPKTDPNFKTPSWYYIAVYGFLSVTFKITVKHDGGQLLLSPGKSATGKMTEAGRYNFFTYKVPRTTPAGEQLTFAAFAKTGSIQIYSSKTNRRPTSEENDKVGARFGASTKIDYQNVVAEDIYYLSVKAETPAEYSVVATQGHVYTNLKEGETHLYSVERQKVKYFVYRVNSPDHDILMTTHVYVGRIGVYVGYGFEPSPSNYTWATNSSTYRGNEIVMDTKDPNRKPGGEESFYVAVYGMYGTSYFSLSASHSNTTVTIRDGQIVPGQVDLYGYRYYKYVTDRTGVLSINLKTMYRNGTTLADSDLFVSKQFPKPSRTNYDWFSNRYGDDHINIDATPGTYYIAVYGARFVGGQGRRLPYQLSASIEYENLNTNGEGTYGYVRKGEMKYYHANIRGGDRGSDSNVGVTLISGDTALYVWDNETKPTNISYKYRDRGWPGNTLYFNRSAPGFKPGTFTFGVYGQIDSEYFIHAAVGPYEAALTINQPKLIEMTRGSNFFRVAGGNDIIQKIDYYLNVNFANVNWFNPTVTIYASQTVRFPSEEAGYTWKLNLNNRNAHMLLDAAKMERSKSIYFNVVYNGRSKMRMRVNFHIPGQPMFVTQDQPQVRDLTANEIGYYLVFRPPQSSKFKVVMESCNTEPPPQLYMSTRRRRPNAGNAEMVSTLEGQYTQTMNNNSVSQLIRNFYVGTDQKPNPRVVSLYATTVDDIRPTPRSKTIIPMGIAQQNRFRISVPGIVYDEAQYPIIYAAFYKKVASFDEKVNMETVCSMWDFNNADFGDFAFQSTPSPNLYMNIPVESHSKYWINVVAMDRYGVRNAYKPIKVEVTGANSLNAGQPIQARSNITHTTQFVIDSLTLPDSDKAVIAVTPYGGEPELWVSLEYPATRDNAIYNATYTGPKMITIDKSNQRGNGPYYVGVSGYTDTIYSIVMYHSKTTSTILHDGVPQLAEVENSKWTYFNFYLDDDSSFTISVSPTVGDPDLFVSHIDERPSYSKHQWSSENPGLDLIHISNTTTNFAPRKTYYIGVYGFTKSIFSLTFTKVLSTELLTENLPHTNIVHGDEYSFFKFRLVYKHDVILSVKPTNPFSDGDPDLCVSTRVPQPRPDRGRGGCMWTSQNSGKDTLVISVDDPRHRVGWYYMSVKGYGLEPNEQLQFTILATTSYHNETLLSDGKPVTVVENSALENYRYFKFYYGYETLANHLTFTVIENVGVVELFVSDSTNSEPTREKHTYSSRRRGRLVEAPLPNTIKEGWYYCGVLTSSMSNYTIVASTNQVPVELTYGAGYFGVVPSGYYKYFSYRLVVEDYDEDIIIATRSYNGDPDIYVSSGYRPTKEKYDFKSYRASRADWVRIPSAVLKARQITLLQIGIHGFSEEDSSFSIIVYRSKTNLRLVNSHPVPGVVKYDEYQYYNYRLSENGRVKFTMQLTSPRPSSAFLCVSRTTEEPNIFDCDYLARGDGLNTYSVTIDDAQAGNYYLGIYGSGGTNTTYVLTATTKYEYIEDGFDVYEQVDKDKSIGFKSFVGRNSKHVLTSVTMVKGRTILYANSNSTIPSPTSYMWKSTDWPGNSLYIDSADKKYKTDTEWSFAVYGVDTVSNFLFSTQTSFGRLRSGIPRTGLVAKGKPAFFYMTIPFFKDENIYIQAKAYDGSCISLFTSFQDIYPNATKYDHHSSSHNRFDTAIIKIAKEEIKDNYMINIGVYGCSEKIHRFEISTATETEPIFLTFDKMYIHTNDKTRPNSWYEVLTNSQPQSLTVQLDVCDDIPVDGSAVLVGNSTRTFPITPDTADFVSSQNGLYSTRLVAKQNVQPNEQYKVTVNLPANRLFSLYTTTDAGDLRPNCSRIAVSEFDDPENKPGERTVGVTTFPVSANAYPVTVKIYSAETGDTMINMDTVCAVLKHGTELDSFTLNRDQTHESKVKLLIAQKYKINAIITDKDGRSTTCKNVDLAKGIDFRASLSFISVGSILILLVIIGIILYLIIGVIFKKIKYGSKGLDLIPNIAFWKDVPFLIGDGIMFLFTCGRKQNKEIQEMDENPFGASEDTYHEI